MFPGTGAGMGRLLNSRLRRGDEGKVKFQFAGIRGAVSCLISLAARSLDIRISIRQSAENHNRRIFRINIGPLKYLSTGGNENRVRT